MADGARWLCAVHVFPLCDCNCVTKTLHCIFLQARGHGIHLDCKASRTKFSCFRSVSFLAPPEIESSLGCSDELPTSGSFQLDGKFLFRMVHNRQRTGRQRKICWTLGFWNRISESCLLGNNNNHVFGNGDKFCLCVRVVGLLSRLSGFEQMLCRVPCLRRRTGNRAWGPQSSIDFPYNSRSILVFNSRFTLVSSFKSCLFILRKII